MLPGLLLFTAAAALLGSILAIWQSLRGAFGAADPATFLSLGGNVSRQALEDEKAALLRGLQDLKFEFQSRKLSDEDYKAQEAVLRSRTREVMRLLDADVEPFRSKAEQLVQKSLSGEGKKGKKSPYRSSQRARHSEPKTVPCSACGASNDLDAAFCKKCGEPMEDASARSDSPKAPTKGTKKGASKKKKSRSPAKDGGREEASTEEASTEEASAEEASAEEASAVATTTAGEAATATHSAAPDSDGKSADHAVPESETDNPDGEEDEVSR